MKKLQFTIALAAMILTSTLVKAQNTPLVQAKFGMATFSDDPKTENLSGSFAWGIGAGMEKSFSDNFYFQPSVNFNSKTLKYDYTYSDPSSAIETRTEYTMNINTLEVPLYFLYKTAEPGAATRFFFGFGPSLGFRVGGRQDGSITTNGANVTTIDEKLSYGSDSSDNFKSFIFGLGVQAGLEFSNKFQVGVEWNYDLNNMSPWDSYKARSGMFGLRLGLLLGGRNY